MHSKTSLTHTILPTSAHALYPCAQLWLSRTVYVDAGVYFDEVAVLEDLRWVRG